MDQLDQIKQSFNAAFEAAKHNRNKPKLNGLYLPGFWKYWLEMGFNPYQHGWNMQELRKDGRLVKAPDSKRLRTSCNLINDQLVDMVSKETANPIQPQIYATDKVYEDIPSGQVDMGESPLQTPAYPRYDKDKLVNLAKRVLSALMDHIKLEDRREDVCYGRRTWGFMGMALSWRPDVGDRVSILKVKNGEQWDIVTGQYTQDGQTIKVRNPESPADKPEFQEYPAESWQRESVGSGGPTLEVFYPWQIFWMGRTTSHDESLGVFLVDYLTKSEAKLLYGDKGLVNGQEVAIDWEHMKTETVPDEGEKPIWFWEFPPATQLYERVRMRRKPEGAETRSQWITRLGGNIVEAKQCPYGRTFDDSRGVYVFFDRKIPGAIEALGAIAFMSPSNTLFNLLLSADVENVDQMPIGKFKMVGGGEEARINYSKQSGVAVVTAEQDFEALEAPSTPQDVVRLQGMMMQMIQKSSTTQDIVAGMREADAPTLGQAELQRNQNQGKLGLNLRRDAREWTKFYRDLLTLMSDAELNRYGLPMRIVEEKTGMGYREFAATVGFFQTIKDIEVGPKSLEDNTNEEINKILFYLGRLPQVVPGAPDPYAATRLGLMKRLDELLDIPGVPKPDETALQAASQAGIMMPAADPRFKPGEQPEDMTLPAA